MIRVWLLTIMENRDTRFIPGETDIEQIHYKKNYSVEYTVWFTS